MRKRDVALALTLWGMALLTSAQTTRAPQAERYAELYALAATSAGSTLALGNLWREMGDPRASLPALVAALLPSPDPALALSLVDAYLALGEYAAALDVLRIAHDAAPRAANLNALLGFLLAPSDPQQAMIHLRAVGFDDRYDDATLPLIALIRQEGSVASPTYSARVGAILAHAGRFALAEYAYRYAVAQQPAFAEALAQIGYMASQQGRDGRAWIAQAVALAPTSPDVRLAQALTLRHMGALDEALDALAVARLYAPTSAVLHHETARTYELIGREDLAAQWRAQASALSAP